MIFTLKTFMHIYIGLMNAYDGDSFHAHYVKQRDDGMVTVSAEKRNVP